MSISHIDGPILKPFFVLLRKTNLAVPILLPVLKVVEYIGNGVHRNGRHDLGRVRWNSFKTLLLTGQSHLDAAWRWRTSQGIIKARATFKKALDHIDLLDEFTFSQPSPQYYQWMKDHYPRIYARMKKAVKDGRFILFGGSWVESDTNIPDGEALVRQRLYGQRFYLNEFGMISDVEFLQDCFGFNANLPQIYKKSGARMFGTGKLFWNSTTDIPIGMCLWESPDGTQLPMIHIHFGYFIPINYGQKYPMIYLLGKPGEKLRANYQTPAKEYTRWRSKELMLENVFGYGLGDGGHGPVEFEIAVVTVLRRLYPKIFKHHQKGDFYAMFKKYFPRWAVWNDEWYLDYHRGTYTSVSRVKRGNRDTENQIEALESLTTLAGLYGFPVDRTEFEKHWKTILYHQFHDILPGSSIPEVYNDYDIDRQNLQVFFDDIRKRLQNFLIQNFSVNNQFGIPIPILNPLSWIRSDIIKINIGSNSKGILRTRNGEPIPTQIVKEKFGRIENDPDSYVALGYLPHIAAMGWEYCYYDEKHSQSNQEAFQLCDKHNIHPIEISQSADQIILDNKLIRVVIDRTTGWIDEIYSYAMKQSVITPGCNKILVFEERNHTDAWNIDPEYNKYPVNYDETPQAINIIEDGPLRAVVETHRYIRKSLFIQRTILELGQMGVGLAMEIDLKDERLLYKLAIPTIIKTNIVSGEISYAFIDRTIEGTTKIDRARWEHASQKWTSITDGKIGLTVINNGKYGYNAIKSPEGTVTLRPTVVRTPVYTGYAKETFHVNRAPDGGLDPTMPKFTDIELHKDIQFWIYPHSGDWRSGVWQKAYELNQPLFTSLTDLNLEANPKNSKANLLSNVPIIIEPETIHCASIKYAEDGYALISPDLKEKQIILRLVEKIGHQTKVSLKLDSSLTILKAEQVDLLELNPKVLANVSKNQVELEIAPYEISTIRLIITRN
jgi:alpha-mannosidase